MIYKTTGICPKEIHFDVSEGKVSNIEFVGGCNGNLKGIAKLCDGLAVQDVIEKLQGITCGTKASSCPDQLTKALQNI